MRKIYLLSIAIACYFSACSQIKDPLRNKVVFEDDISEVGKAIVEMENLLYKLPEADRINCFMDNDGALHINNEKLGSLEGGINNSIVRENKAFQNFTEDEIDSFFKLWTFLFNNHMDGVYMNTNVGSFMFEYRRTLESRYNDLRLIALIKDDIDFTKQYQTLDKQYVLTLLAPSDAIIR